MGSHEKKSSNTERLHNTKTFQKVPLLKMDLHLWETSVRLCFALNCVLFYPPFFFYMFIYKNPILLTLWQLSTSIMSEFKLDQEINEIFFGDIAASRGYLFTCSLNLAEVSNVSSGGLLPLKSLLLQEV